MPQLILDVMGGDRGPQVILEGAQQALPELEGELVLVGDENVLRPLLAKRPLRLLNDALTASASTINTRSKCSVRLVHSSDTIEMSDSIRSLRNKPNASINIGCRMASESWKARKSGAQGPAAFISAGHSGAMMASALLNMGRLKGVERPGIAVTLPTLSQDGCVVIDVGANVDCKPEHLRDFAVMGAVFAQVDRKSPGLPRVGILSNGEEKSKGNELTRAALEMVEKHPTFAKVGQFVGYSEGKEIFKGHVDVVVTDGFVGNVVLKSVEGLGSAVVQILKEQAKRNPLTMLGFLLAAQAFRGLKKKLDYAEYGAAPLLGVAGYSFVCHGRSNSRAIKNALLRAQSAVNKKVVENLDEVLSQQ